MAQGGHGWPGGQFNANEIDPNGAANHSHGAIGYGDGLDQDTNMLYMQDWDSLNAAPTNFGGVQPQDNPPEHQFFDTTQSYYGAPNAYPEGARQTEHRNSTASPALAYGNDIYQDSNYPRPVPQANHQQQQPYQQFHAAELGHRNPSPSNFADNSWQTQPPSNVQNQYTHHALGYDSPQGIYQHVRPGSHAHAHASTPPAHRRNVGQFAAAQAGQPRARPNVIPAVAHGAQGPSSSQPSNEASSQYQFQVNQMQPGHGEYQHTTNPRPSSATAYQNQIRFQPPVQPNGQSSALISSSHPGSQQQQGFPAQRPASVAQKPLARTETPILPPNHGLITQTGLSYANHLPIPGQSIAAPPSQQQQETPNTFTVPSPPPFNPAAYGQFSQLAEAPNLYVSNVPTDAQEMEFLPEDNYTFSAHFNASDGPLIPHSQKRLPCEIRRDWKWLRKQEKSAEDAKRRAILLEKDRLNREMVYLTGENIEPSNKPVTKKTITKGGSKANSTRKTGSESSDDSSEYESDSDFEESKEDQEARKIKAGGRPTDLVKAVEFDVIQAVWRDPNEVSPPNATANAIQAFGVHIEKLWTKAKDLKKDVKAAKEKKSKKLDSLEAELATQLKLMRCAIETANKFAETSVLENMGGNAKLAVILWNALRSSLATRDFNGPLPKAILFLMSHFTTMEKSLVTGVLKVPDYQKKHQKDFDKICLSYLDHIQSKAKGAANDVEKKAKDTAALNGSKDLAGAVKKAPLVMARDLVSASKKSVSTESKKAISNGATTLEARKVSGSVNKAITGSPSKRPRDDDVDSRATKKVAVDGAPNTSLATKPATTSQSKTTTVVQPRPKTSGSILPGRNRPVVKPAVKKSEPQQSSSLSTISGLLAEIAKPKSPPRQKEEPVSTPETEEEKKRRLRKEARRGLRVMWKPDQELEEVRIFQHDAAEDEGRATNMVRDARDNRSEGQALKRARVNHSDVPSEEAEKEEEEDEAEQGRPNEITLRDWKCIRPVDFSHIDKVSPGQREKTFTTRGGVQAFHTQEQQFMEKYEQTQLMAVYTSPADIPETPKSPSRREAEIPDSRPNVSQLPSDYPTLQEIHLRWTEIAQFGTDQATQRLIQRLRSRSSPERAAKFDRILSELQDATMSSQDRNQPYAFAPSASRQSHPQQLSSSAAAAPVMSQTEREATVLRLLRSEKVLKWTDVDPVNPTNFKTRRRFDYGDPKTQSDVDTIESLAATYAGKPWPITEPPEHLMSNPGHVKEWQTGYNNDLADRATLDATERARKLAEEFSRKNLATSVQTIAQPVVPQTAQDSNAAAWAAYFAQMGGQAQLQQSQGQQLTYDQYAAILQQTQALQAQQGVNAVASAQAPSYPQQQEAAQQDPNGHIGALLAALGGQAAQPQAVASASQAVQDPNAAAWAAYYASMAQVQPQAAVAQQQQSQGQQQTYQHRDRDRERGNRNTYGNTDAMLDYGPSETEPHDKNQRGRKDNASITRENFRGKNYDQKGINRSLIGTKPCSFWAQGKCAKGDQCTFRHDPNDLVK